MRSIVSLAMTCNYLGTVMLTFVIEEYWNNINYGQYCNCSLFFQKQVLGN